MIDGFLSPAFFTLQTYKIDAIKVKLQKNTTIESLFSTQCLKMINYKKIVRLRLSKCVPDYQRILSKRSMIKIAK